MFSIEKLGAISSVLTLFYSVNGFANEGSSSIDALIEELPKMDVLVSEVADSCELDKATSEAKAKVSNRAYVLSEAGEHEEAIECYLSLLEKGEHEYFIVGDLSISYSKSGQCESAEEYAEKYTWWANRYWIEWSDLLAAQEDILAEGKDWTDFSNHRSVVTPYEDVEDPQKDGILKALKECRENFSDAGT